MVPILAKIRMDFNGSPKPVPVYAMQNDVNSRAVEISVYQDGKPYEGLDALTPAVAFEKPDGTKGLYDKLPNGESALAISGNVVTVMLAPQVLTCAGLVFASIVFYSQDMVDTLATFPFQIYVEKNPGAGQQISNNYYYLQNMEQVNEAYTELLNRVITLYIGPGDMPDGYNIQIDPEGDAAPFFENVTLGGSKNLCHIGTVTFERGSGYLEIGSTLEAGKTYTFSAEVTSTDTDSATGVCAIYLATSTNVMLDPKYTIHRGTRASVTFECPNSSAPVSKIVFYASGTAANSSGDTATFAYIQIEEGSVATSYVPAENVELLTAIDYVARRNMGKPPCIVSKTRWLAVGDSITRGVYSYKNGDASASAVGKGWVRKLAQALDYDIVVMASRGMGYTAAVTGQDPDDSSLPRISLDTLLTRIEALEDDFNLITLAFGINDYATKSQATLDTIGAGLDDAIQRLATKFPSARLVVITPFNSCREGDASTNYAYGYAYGGRSLKDVADLIKARCESHGVECIYASNGFLINNFNISTLLPDNTHPSDNGHTLIAKNMAHYLLN